MRLKTRNTSRKFIFEQLEPRLLLSADLDPISLAGALPHENIEFVSTAVETGLDTAIIENNTGAAADHLKNEIFFVDTNIQDYNLLINDLLASADSTSKIEIITLDAVQNGIEQISEILSQRQDIDTVHIISHGTDGSVKLGNGWLTSDNISSYSDTIGSWQDSLSSEADLLLYGCDLAAGQEGRALVSSLASLTGADVAASDDLTGNAELGGDWNLEYTVGSIESKVAVSQETQANWSDVLANVTISGTVFQENRTTPIGNETVHLIVNGNDEGTVNTDGSGNFSITADIAIGESFLIYVDDGNAGGDTVSVATYNGGSPSLDLYFNHMYISDNLTTTDLKAALGTYDGGNQIGYTVTGTELDVNNTYLYIPSGVTFTPDDIVYVDNMIIAGTINGGGNTFGVDGDWDASGGTFNAGPGSTLNFTSGSPATFNPGPSTYENIILNKGGGKEVTLSNNLTAAGDIIITRGNLDVSSSNYSITLAGDFVNSDTFTAQNGTVTLTGTNQNISGSTTFHNLSKSVTIADTLTFGAGDTITIAPTGTLTLDGDPGELLTVSSSSPGTHWLLALSPGSFTSLDYLDVSWSDATPSDSSHTPIDPGNSTDSGNNTLWFAAAVNNSPSSSGIADVTVNVDAPDTVIDLFATFDDAEDADSALAYTIPPGGNTNPGLFTSTLIDGVAGTLTLVYAPGQNGTADITIRATDTGLLYTESTFTVMVNAAPTIGGTVAGQAVDDVDFIAPFSGVTIGDIDIPAQTLTVTVTLDDPAYGTFSTLSGFTETGPSTGIFTYSGTAADATTAIRGLVYDPANNRVATGDTETTIFTIDVEDGIATTVSDSTTTVDSLSVDVITISGKVYTDEGSTAIADGTAVRVLVNGISRGTTATFNGDGSYSISNIPVVGGESILVYLDDDGGPGNLDNTNDGVTVSVTDGNNQGNFDIYVDHVIVRHDDGGIMTNALMAAAKDTYSDTEIIYTVAGSDLTVNGADTELYLMDVNPYTPGGDITAPNFETLEDFDGGTFEINISGDLTVSKNTFSGNSSTINVGGDLVISGGDLDSTSGILTVGGDFSSNDHSFNHNNGTVILDGSSQVISGSNHFYNLSKSVSAAATLTFQDGKHIRIDSGGSITLRGAPGQLLSLESSTPGSQWDLTLQAGVTTDIEYVAVSDADASSSDGSEIPVNAANSLDVTPLNNIDWFIYPGGTPGGVMDSIQLWIKADDGTLVSGPVSQWDNLVVDGTANGTLPYVEQLVNGAKPIYTADALNYNPVVIFDGANDDLHDSLVDGDDLFQDDQASIFIVEMELFGAGFGVTLQWLDNLDNRVSVEGPGPRFDYGDFDRAPVAESVTGTGLSANYHIINTQVVPSVVGGDPEDFEIYIDGRLDTSYSATNNPLNAGPVGSFSIGDYPLGGFNRNTAIAEVIIYNTDLSAAERMRVESYLAVKYGMTLDQTAPNDYLDSDGNVIWNATFNSTYSNDIAGIGTDVTSGLSQTQSSSINSDSIITVSGASSQDDGDFLLWGNDNGGLSVTASNLPAGVTQRLERIWTIEETGDIGTVTISFDISGIAGVTGTAATDFKLIIDSDTTFTGGATIVPAASFAGNIVTFNNVNFSDGQFFALGTDSVNSPVITDGPDTSDLTETDAGLTDSGTLTVTDADTTDVVTASVDSVVVTGTGASSVPAALTNAILKGFLTVTPTTILDNTETTDTLTWNFNSGTEAFNFLATGETLILTYTVKATDDGSPNLNDTENVVVTITGSNDPPTLTTFTTFVDTVNEDTEVEITFAELAAQGNEADADGTVDAFVIQAVSTGTLKIGTDAGSAAAFAAGSNDTVDTTNKAYWTPDNNDNGTINAFTVVAEDDDGAESVDGNIQVQVSVTDINDPPTLTTFTTFVDTVNEDTEVEITFAELAAQGNEADADGTVDAFVIQAVSTGTLKIGTDAGSAAAFAAGSNDTVDTTNKAYWTPDNNDNGTINAFTVVAEDDDGAESVDGNIQVQVSVTDINDPPTLTTFTTFVDTVNEDTEVEITFAELAAQGNEADADGTVDAFVIQAVSTGTLKIGTDAGSAAAFAAGSNDTVDTTNKAYWTPDNNDNGTINAFTVVAEDDDGAESVDGNIQVQVSVTDINDPPTLTTFTTFVDTVNEDTEVEITFAELAAQGNEADADGTVDAFVIQAVSTGTLKIGTDAGSAAAFAAGSNDTVDTTNKAYWTPDNNDNGTINAFTVVAEDDDGAESVDGNIQVQVSVTDINDPPTLTTFTTFVDTVNEDTEVEITFAELAAQGNEADADGTVDAFVIQAVSTGTLKIGTDAGSAAAFAAGSNDTVDTTNKAYWTPDNNDNGTINAFTVVAEDDDGAESVDGNIQVQVSVTDINDPPTLTTFTTFVDTVNEDTEVEITFAELAAQGNEADADGTVDAFVIQAVSTGTLKIGTDAGSAAAFAAGSNDTVDTTNKAYWTPDNNDNGTINAFTVVAEDDDGAESVDGNIQVQVSVTDINDPPTLTTFTTFVDTVNEDTEVEITFAELAAQGNEADADGTVDAFVIQAVSTGTLKIGTDAGSAAAFAAGSNDTVDTTNKAYWTPDNNDNGTINAFTVVAEDDDGAESVDGNIQVQVSVTDINDPPTLTTFTTFVDTVNEDTEVEITFAELAAQGNEADADGTVDAFVIQAVSTGTLKIGTDAGSAAAFAAGSNDTVDTTNKAYWTPDNNDNGTINAFTVVAEDDDGAESVDGNIQVQVSVTDINDPPTLTTFTTFVDTVNEDTEVEITFAELAAQGNEADADGTVDAFVIQAVSTGTLKIGTDAGSAAAFAAGSNDTVDTTNKAYWTPDNNDNGTINAFTVVAEDDDGAESVDGNIQVQVSVTDINDPPTLTTFTTFVDTVNEDTEVEITFAELAAQGNEADADGTVDAFVIQAVSTGTLKIGTDAGSAAAFAAGSNDTVDTTNKAYWTPDNNDNGTINAFTVVAEDDDGAESVDGNIQVQVSVTDINDPPTLTTFTTFVDTVNEDTEVEITFAELAAQGNEADADGTVDAFVIQAVSTGTLKIGTDAGSAAAFAAGSNDTVDTTNKAYWTPDNNDNGTINAFTVVAEDDDGAESVDGNIQVQVSVTDINDPPVLAAIGDQTVDELDTLTFTASATDPADDPANTMTYSLDATSLLAGMTINSASGAFSWTPTETQDGVHSVTVTATDDGTPNLSASETFDITVGEVNELPVLAAIGDQTVDELDTLTFNASATDPDDDPANTMTYSLDATSLLAGMTINSASGAFSWTPTETQDGVHSVTVTATDDGTPNLSASETFDITVGEVNELPVLAAIGDQTVDELDTLTFTASATDPDDDPANTMTYSLDATSLLAGMTINSASGAFSWTPTETQDGVHSVTVTATDDGTPNLSASETFDITVGEVNELPVLAAIGDQTVDELDTLTFTASATDPDDDPANTMTYSLDATSLLAGMTINSASGAFSWTPTETQDGVHSVTVTATDDGTPNLSDSETFDITVGEVNELPVLAAIGDQTVDELDTLTFNASATDPDDDPANTMTYSLDATSLLAGMTINSASGAFSWTPTETQDGVHSVTVTATDDGTPNLSDSETFDIKVNEVNVAPTVVNPIPDQTATEDSPFSYTFDANTFDDIDLPANTLTYSASLAGGTPLPAWLSFDPVTRELSGTPAYNDVDTLTVEVTAYDGNPGGTASNQFDLTVDEKPINLDEIDDGSEPPPDDEGGTDDPPDEEDSPSDIDEVDIVPVDTIDPGFDNDTDPDRDTNETNPQENDIRPETHQFKPIEIASLSPDFYTVANYSQTSGGNSFKDSSSAEKNVTRRGIKWGVDYRITSNYLRKSFDAMEEETSKEAKLEKTVIGSAIAASTSLSVGYVVWLLRSGMLLSSLLSSMPAWQIADPLPILAKMKENDNDDDDESIEDIIGDGDTEPDKETMGKDKKSTPGIS